MANKGSLPFPTEMAIGGTRHTSQLDVVALSVLHKSRTVDVLYIPRHGVQHPILRAIFRTDATRLTFSATRPRRFLILWCTYTRSQTR